MSDESRGESLLTELKLGEKEEPMRMREDSE